jgi:iron(III) transport system substrate-binding protein
VQANEPTVLFSSGAIVDVVAAGEAAQVGFGSHYYLYDMLANGNATNVAAKFYPRDPTGLLSVDGVGIINGTDNEAAANAFVDFLLSQTAERYFAAGNVEIPIVNSVEPREGKLTANEMTVQGLGMQLEELDDAPRAAHRARDNHVTAARTGRRERTSRSAGSGVAGENR